MRIFKNFKGIIDSTLREGFQFSKANFSVAEQKRIFSYLDRIRVDYVEVGNPSKMEIQEMIREIIRTRRGSPVRILSHIRNHERDVAKAVESGVDGVNILCTVDPERLAAMNMTCLEYMEKLGRNVETAKKNSLEVRVGVEDFFGQPVEKSYAVYQLAESLKVQRVGVADTLGKTMNWEVARRIRELRRCLTVDIEVHFHNDLGHAVSNALVALQSGANWVSTSLLGIGERTGITPLSSLLVNLYVMDSELARRYNLKLLTRAENYISRICNIEMPPHLMTNTSNGFAHKAGIHLNALMRLGPQKYELLPPKLIGNKRNLVTHTLLSGKTGAQDVKEFQKKFG
ncbi:MAG: LeuA family protein [Candidatus Aminicenantales bacterium]